MKNIWPLSVILTLGLGSAPHALGQDKAQPVSVAVDETISPIVRVSTATMSLSGTASGGAGVTKVTWQTSNGAAGTAFGTGTWEAQGIPVTEGNTTIVLRAYDAKGASSWVALVAIRPVAEPPIVITSAATLQRPPAL